MKAEIHKGAGMRKSILLCLLALALAGVTLALASRPASAAMTCSMAAADLAFGSFDVLAGAAVSSSTGATITCSGGSANTAYRFCVNARQGPDYSAGQRHMLSGSNLLSFEIYTDSAHTTAFGNYIQPYDGGGLQIDFTSDGSGAVSGPFTIYGAVLSSQQTAAPGSYSESLGEDLSIALCNGDRRRRAEAARQAEQ